MIVTLEIILNVVLLVIPLTIKFSDAYVPMCRSMVTSLVRLFGLFVVVEKAATKIK